MTKSVLNALPKISKKNHTNTKKRVPAAVVKAEDKKEASVAPTEVMNLGNKTAHVATPEVPTEPVKLEKMKNNSTLSEFVESLRNCITK